MLGDRIEFTVEVNAIALIKSGTMCSRFAPVSSLNNSSRIEIYSRLALLFVLTQPFVCGCGGSNTATNSWTDIGGIRIVETSLGAVMLVKVEWWEKNNARYSEPDRFRTNSNVIVTFFDAEGNVTRTDSIGTRAMILSKGEFVISGETLYFVNGPARKRSFRAWRLVEGEVEQVEYPELNDVEIAWTSDSSRESIVCADELRSLSSLDDLPIEIEILGRLLNIRVIERGSKLSLVVRHGSNDQWIPME